MLLSIATLALVGPHLLPNKCALRHLGRLAHSELDPKRGRPPWRRDFVRCSGTTSSNELEPPHENDSEQFTWISLDLEESRQSTQELDDYDYDLLDIGYLDDDEDGWADAPHSPVQVVSFDLDDTLWPTGEVIGAANAALQSYLEIEYPAVLSAAHRLVVEEGIGGAVPTLMRQLHKARMKADPSLPKSPLNLTNLRTEALIAAAQEAGLDKARQLGEECFAVWASARHQACESLLFPGVVEALWKLRREGIILGSITNGNADVAMIPSLKGLFTFSITAEACGASKPSTIPFEAAATAAGVPTFGPQ